MEYLDWLIEWVYNSDSKKSLMDLPVEIQKKFKKKNSRNMPNVNKSKKP